MTQHNYSNLNLDMPSHRLTNQIIVPIFYLAQSEFSKVHRLFSVFIGQTRESVEVVCVSLVVPMYYKEAMSFRVYYKLNSNKHIILQGGKVLINPRFLLHRLKNFGSKKGKILIKAFCSMECDVVTRYDFLLNATRCIDSKKESMANEKRTSTMLRIVKNEECAEYEDNKTKSSATNKKEKSKTGIKSTFVLLKK